MKLLPLEKSVLRIVIWSLLGVAGFFFHIVAFFVVMAMLYEEVAKFTFVYQNTKETKKEVPYDSATESNNNGHYEQLVIPGTEGT